MRKIDGEGAGFYRLTATAGNSTATAPTLVIIENDWADGAEIQPPVVYPADVSISAPQSVRAGRTGTLVITYRNPNPFDITAPLLSIASTNGTISFSDPDDPNDFTQSLELLGIAPNGPAGILRPGQSGSLTVTLLDDDTIDGDSLPIEVGVIEAGQGIDWASQEAADKPNTFSTAAWNVVFSNAIAGLGDTSDSYSAALAQVATYLGSLGETPSQIGDVGRLWSFLIAQANATFPTATLTSAVDASLPTPGSLALAIDRTFVSSIAGRYQPGIFGLGWTTSWQASLNTDASGNVTIDAGGSLADFIQMPNGTYADTDGEYGTLTSSGGVFTFTASTGTQYVFLGNGDLNYVQDTDGNRITLGYNAAGQITSLTYANPNDPAEPTEQLILSYNGEGFVSSVADGTGDTWAYTHDAAGHLLSVTAPGNRTTSYSYDTGTNSETANALLSTTNPDGSQQNFTYDPTTGRLTGTSESNVAQPTQLFNAISYAYPDEAEVVAADAGNNQTTIWFNDLGSPARVQDPLGNLSTYLYDNNGNLVNYTDAAGGSYQYSYDRNGNVTQSVNPLGQTAQMTYGSLSNLTSLTDADGNTTQYTYDSAGNQLSIAYPDGTTESFQYDPLGNMIDTIEQNGDPVTQQYNSQGLPTLETFADGTSQAFTYDGHGNMLTAKTFDATDTLTGTTTLTYNAANELTSIVYPNGQFLNFTYNAAGQRTQSVDQDGFTVNYAYDGLDRLSELTDGSGNSIAQYTYNNLDQLAEKQIGNGTVTTYAYDPAGNLLSEVNYANVNQTTVNSSYTYTYNDLNEETSVTDAAGNVTTYGYDATGQLTSVTLPGGSTIAYLYNAAGDRTDVITNGTPTSYVSNADNEITQVGSTTYTYDANGNLRTVTDASGTTTYTYNDLNQLVSIANPDGSVQSFQYSPLGFMVGTGTTSGANTSQTNYLVDPTGLGNVVASYNGSGSLIANYVYGLGLVSQTGPSGTGYYDFDASANTIGITGTNGTYVNQYSYLPFGETTTLSATLPNPFTFGGQAGVIYVVGNHFSMRARNFDSTTGQFLSNDPLGLNGGDANTRRYAGNQPTTLIDPSGLADKPSFGPDFDRLTPAEQDQALDGAAAILFAPLYVDRLENDIESLEDARDGVDVTEYGGSQFKALYQEEIDADKAQLLKIYQFEFLGGNDQQSPKGPNSLTNSKTADPGQATPATNATPRNAKGGDPNALIGPAGFGSQAFIDATGNESYTVEFENDGSAAAQDVAVTEQLDANLDWTTFQLGSFGFGPVNVTIPAGLTQYETTVSYKNTDGTSLNVDVALDFNVQTGLLTVTFTSLDPLSGQAPAGVFDGFLPPDDSSGIGEGYVQYTAQPQAILATGTTITQHASVVFDINAPIVTNTVTNTIDSVAPTSSVNSLPANSLASFPVSWSGQDDAGGSGIAFYDVYVSIDDAPWQLWQSQTTQTSAIYPGQIGHNYAFFSVATDDVGNLEATLSTSHAQTQTAGFQTTLNESENTTKPVAQSINSMLTGHYSDPDGSANTKPGIAIIGVNGNGTWQYSTNGATWPALGNVSLTAALLLPAADSLRFVPAQGYSGQAQLLYLAWDGSLGTAGKTFNLANVGGTTPFSTSAGQLTVKINPIPTWVSTGAALAPILPGTYSPGNQLIPAGNTIASVFGSYFQDNNAAISVGVAIESITGLTSGTWQYLLSTGSTWTNFPTVSSTSALLLSANDQIRFVPKNNFAGTAMLKALGWDGSVGTDGTTANPAKLLASAFSTTMLTATAAANRAPTLTSATIPPISDTLFATSAAITVGSLLAEAGYRDPDGNGLPEGIAIVGDANTILLAPEYKLVGGSWQELSGISMSSALLLPRTASLRVVATNFAFSTSLITFLGWDETQGVAGQAFDIASTGDSNAFSNTSNQLFVTVGESNHHAPTLSTTTLTEPAVPLDTVSPAISVATLLSQAHYAGSTSAKGIAITGVNASGGTEQYLLAGGSWQTLPNASLFSALLLPSNASLRYVADGQLGTATLTFLGWDETQGSAGTYFFLNNDGNPTAFSSSSATVSITIISNAPTLSKVSVALPAVNENAISPVVTAASLNSKAGYADTGGKSLPSGIAIAGDTGPGTWQWLNSSTWTALPNVSSTSVFLLPSTAQLRFQPNDSLTANTNGSATLTYLGWDETEGTAETTFTLTSQGGTTAFSTAAATAKMPVNYAKPAPVWLPGAGASFTPVLGLSASNPTPNPAGETVAAVFGSAFLDAPGISVGVAISAQTGTSFGVWEYSTNGGTSWQEFPIALSSTAALVLSATDMIRFVPSKNYSGLASLTAYAWDGAGNFANTIANVIKTGAGGSHPFSTTTLTANCLLNSAPVLT